jgi:hypothetical protein
MEMGNPIGVKNQATLNVLKYLAGYLSIWMDMHMGNAMRTNKSPMVLYSWPTSRRLLLRL